MNTQREASRNEWNSDNTREDINSGSLQRIADACEKMCRDREQLEQKCQYLRRRHEILCEELAYLYRSNAALRGVITKLKRKSS